MKIYSRILALIAAAGLFTAVGLAGAWEQGSSGSQQGSSPGGQSQEQSSSAMNMNDPQTVKNVQQSLSNEGYDAGPADGNWSSKSQQAMTKFQNDNNLQPTGQINQESLTKLGLMPSTGSSAAGGQEKNMPEQQSGMSSDQQSGAGGQTAMSMKDPETVKGVQQKLNNEGYKAGPANGKWSKKSQQAMTQFQKDNDLEPTGQINQESLVQLGLMPPAGSAGAGGQGSTMPEQERTEGSQESGAGGEQGMTSQESTTGSQPGGMSDQQSGAGGQAGPEQGGKY